jgi:hypothetical protein
MKKILVERGGVVVLCDASQGIGGSWGDDGNIRNPDTRGRE